MINHMKRCDPSVETCNVLKCITLDILTVQDNDKIMNGHEKKGVIILHKYLIIT